MRKMLKKISFRGWLTVITLVLLGVVVVAAWPEVVKAWNLLNQVNLWILALLIPMQFFSYYATGGMIFSYLRAKGDLKDVSHWQMTRIALELNFVNHILPSGGAAGFSYLSWILARHGVSAGRSTVSQLIRFALTFISFILLLVIAVIALIIDHAIDRNTILLCLLLTVLAVGATLGMIYVIGSKSRMENFAKWVTRVGNKFVKVFTRGKKKNIVKESVILNFFSEVHDDYLAIRREKKLLFLPFVWAVLANLADVALLWISFWALGYTINPALLFVAFGLSSIASAVSVTPGGAGVYEAVMITFLASVGVPADVAIAGTLIARVSLLVMTIGFGYVFYQTTVNAYGKRPPIRQ